MLISTDKKHDAMIARKVSLYRPIRLSPWAGDKTIMSFLRIGPEAAFTLLPDQGITLIPSPASANLSKKRSILADQLVSINGGYTARKKCPYVPYASLLPGAKSKIVLLTNHLGFGTSTILKIIKTTGKESCFSAQSEPEGENAL